MKIKIAINGFGRIGRAVFKLIQDREDVELVAINDLTDLKTLVHLLKYDTVYGKYDCDVKDTGDSITVSDKKINFYSEKDPEKLPWEELGVDVVLECTGMFVKDGASIAHIKAGAKKVVVSAPTKGTGDILTYVKGVNDDTYNNDEIVSNASCTTNCISPVISVIHKALGVKKAALTTIHAYTSTQNLVDSPSKDLRRARAAAANMIPTTTGAAIATTKTIPDLKGKFDGIAIRVPVINGSISDITMLVEKKTTAEEVNDLYIKAQDNPIYKGVLEASNEPLVSSDIVGNPHSAIVDLGMTKVVEGDLIKVLAWYDNEWGYSNRLLEMAVAISQ